MDNNDDIKQRYLDLIEDGGNVSETSDVKEFFTVIGIIIALLLTVFFASDYIAKIYINHMTNETQAKIEKMLAGNIYIKPNPKYNNELQKLNNIKNKIIPLDKNLQGKSKFPIQIYPSKEVNAFVMADGSIYFTEGLLKEIKNEDELAFILAHELGHYSHRDHLKFMGRQIIIAAVLTTMSIGQSNQFSSFANSANEISNITYSQKQEEEADKYANHIVLSLYGTNKGAVDFFKRLEEKEKMPQFMHYFSTHPSPQYRIKLLKNNR